MADEEHHLNPDSGNPLNDGFGFVFSILATLILTDLLAGVIPAYLRQLAGDPGPPLVVIFLVVPVGFEIVRAALDNHFYTQERDDPIHRDRVRFEVARYGIHFVSIVALFVAVRALVGAANGTTPAFLAVVVCYVAVGFRYASELVWQLAGPVRQAYRAPEASTWRAILWTLRGASSAESGDPLETISGTRDVEEAGNTVPGYATILAVYLLFGGVWAVGWGPNRFFSPVFPDGTLALGLLAGAAILAANWLYLRLWNGYYDDLLGLTDEWDTPDEFLTAMLDGDVAPGDAYQELLRLDEDPGDPIAFDHTDIDWRDTSLGELAGAISTQHPEYERLVDRIRATHGGDGSGG